MNIAGTGIALEPSAYSPGLSLSREDFRALCEQIIPLVMAELFEKRASPAYYPVPAAVRNAFLDTPLPRGGCPLDSILDDVARTVLPYPSPNGHPLSVAWCGSLPAPFALLGHFLLAAMNSLCSGGDHAAAYVEQCVINRLSELVGFPSTSLERRAGLLASGGSLANLLASMSAMAILTILLFGEWHALHPLPVDLWALLYVAGAIILFPTLFGAFMQKYVEPVTVSFIYILEPILSAVVAFFSLHESFSPAMYAGEVIVLRGVVLQTAVGPFSDQLWSFLLRTWQKRLIGNPLR